MTIPSGPVTTGPSPGDGSNNQWPFDFSVASASEVEVIRSSTAGGETIIPSDDYTVSLTSDGSDGGRVYYPISTERVPAGDSVTIRINPIFDQGTDLKSQGDYSPEVVEGALDHIVRQTQRLRADQGRMLQAGAGFTIDNNLGAPIDGKPLTWHDNGDGTWTIIAGSLEDGTPTTIRPLYADDLGLAGNGTDESDAINAALLTYEGQTVIIHLKAVAGYWPISKQILNRSGIQLSFGSTIRATKDGCLGMIGTVTRLSAGATLTVAAVTGATSLLASAVSGALSGSFSINDQVAIGGGGVTNIYRITAINDAGTLTITPGLTGAVAVGTSVRKLRSTYVSSGWTRHDTPTELPVASVSGFAVGDIVWVTDDELITHINTIDTFNANNTLAMVIGFGSGTIKFDRPIKHWCLLANRPRVVRIDPCRSASISGAVVEFTQAPDATRVDVFNIVFGYDCHYDNCKVPNTDDYGTRGQSFRMTRSLSCTIESCYVGPAKYYDSGESYGASLVHCTNCHVVGFSTVGSRHGVSFSGSEDCTGRLIAGDGWRVNLIDFHGLKEIGCHAYVVNGAGNSDYAGVSGICYGNPSWPGGTYECDVIGGEITDMEGTEGAGIRINSPVDACRAHAVVFRRVTEGIRAQNFQGSPTLESGRIEIICDFYRCAIAAVIDMNRFGGTAKPFNRISLDGSSWFDWINGLLVDNVDDIVAKVTMQTTVAGAGTYAVTLANCTSALISGLYDGCQKHFTCADTKADFTDYTIRNPNTTTLLDETSAAPVSGGVRDISGLYPSGWSPGRSSPQTTVTVFSRPGMT